MPPPKGGKFRASRSVPLNAPACEDRKSTRLNSSHLVISYAVFCLKKKKHTSELQSPCNLVCRLLLEKKKKNLKKHFNSRNNGYPKSTHHDATPMPVATSSTKIVH